VELVEEVKKHNVSILIGASGTFESFEAMIREEDKFESEVALAPLPLQIDLTEFDDLFWRLVNSTTKERKKMKGLENMRIEFIVLAALQVKFLIDKLKISRLFVSNYALKEGIMYDLVRS